MLNSSTFRQTSLLTSVLSVTWVLCSARHRKDIFCYPAPTLVQSGERIPEMHCWFTVEQRDFETRITDQTLLSVMAVRMWSYLTLVLTKCKSLTVPLIFFLLPAEIQRTKIFKMFYDIRQRKAENPSD